MTTVTLTREAAQQVLDALKNSNRVVWHYAYSKSTTSIALSCDEALTIMQAAIEAKPADTLEPEYWQWRLKADRWSIDQIFRNEVFATTDDSEVRKLYTTPPAPQAPAQELTKPDLQRLWIDAMYANRQSTTDAAMEFGFAVQAALMAPEQKLEPLAGGWGVD